MESNKLVKFENVQVGRSRNRMSTIAQISEGTALGEVPPLMKKIRLFMDLFFLHYILSSFSPYSDL